MAKGCVQIEIFHLSGQSIYVTMLNYFSECSMLFRAYLNHSKRGKYDDDEHPETHHLELDILRDKLQSMITVQAPFTSDQQHSYTGYENGKKGNAH